jgi:hypothetical protein
MRRVALTLALSLSFTVSAAVALAGPKAPPAPAPKTGGGSGDQSAKKNIDLVVEEPNPDHDWPGLFPKVGLTIPLAIGIPTRALTPPARSRTPSRCIP